MPLSLNMANSPSEMALATQWGGRSCVGSTACVTLCAFQLEVSTVLLCCMNKASSLLAF